MSENKYVKKLKELWRVLTTIKDTPHTIALGAAVGIAWNFIPSLGVGPILSVVCAKALRASGISAVSVNLGTGFFIPLMYSLNLIVGRTVTGQWFSNPEVGKQLQDSLQQSIDSIEQVVEQPSLYLGLSRITNMGLDFFLGGFLNAIMAGVVLYCLIMLPILIRKRLARSS